MSKNQPNNPFMSGKTYEGKKDFDKYYLDVSEKQVFKESGDVDPETGEKLGVIETKLIIKPIDIDEYIKSQEDSVGVEAYMRALAVQGDDISTFNTVVSENVNDFSKCPDNLADTMLLGDKAKAAFESLDPALKGEHTTIEGFLNSLTKDSVDDYIKAKIEALMPKKEGD